jgi:putative Holliday junction resolvase
VNENEAGDMQRVLGLDVGDRRIGVSVSDPTRTIARPLETIVRASRKEDFAAIAALVAEHDVGLIVVGRPLSLDGSEGPQARRIAHYAAALAESLNVPVTSWDERYTTVTAEEILGLGSQKKRRARRSDRGGVDTVAAAVILQSYLDSLNRPSHDNEE